MKRFCLLQTASIICVSFIFAQGKTTLVQRINEIKTQNDIYFWDTYTHPNADTAKVGAARRLLLEINCLYEGKTQFSVKEIMPYISYINIDRGNLKQYFVYIRKDKAASLGDKRQSSTSNNEGLSTIPVTKVFVPDAFVQRMMEAKNFMNVYNLLKSQQTDGIILQFGKLRDVEDYSSLDLILFDMQTQEILTMLSSVNASGYRTNMTNGMSDSLENYPTSTTAVIWYIKK